MQSLDTFIQTDCSKLLLVCLHISWHCCLCLSFLQIHTVDSCVSLVGQCILLSVLLLAAAAGGGRLKPEGSPEHPGTSCLHWCSTCCWDGGRHMHRHERAVTWDGCWLWDLTFGCAGFSFISAHLSYFLAPLLGLCSRCALWRVP